MSSKVKSKIGLGVIGSGWMGDEYARVAKQLNYAFLDFGLDVQLVMVAHRTKKKAEIAKYRHGFLEYTTDWTKLVEHPKVDVVVIATPNIVHKEMVVLAAKAGKHVLCEKPVGVSPEETRLAAKAVKEAGVLSGCGYNYRFMPAIRHARNLVQKGVLGRPFLTQCFFYSRYGDSKDALWSWRFSKEVAGDGVSADLLSHCIDMAHYLCGPISSVQSTKKTFYKKRPFAPNQNQFSSSSAKDLPMKEVTNEDYVSVLAKFVDGSSGFFESSRSLYGPKNPFDVRFYGSEGSLNWNLEQMNELNMSLRKDDCEGYAKVLTNKDFPYMSRLGPNSTGSNSFADSKLFELAHFLKTIKDGELYYPNLEQAAQVADVVEAVTRSWDTKRVESIKYTYNDFESVTL